MCVFFQLIILRPHPHFTNHVRKNKSSKPSAFYTFENPQARRSTDPHFTGGPKIIPALKNLLYCERLKTCKIRTLHYRRIRGDMTETYKIVTGKCQPCVAPTLCKGNVFVTRGNDLRLEKSQVKYDLRKFGFTNRVVNTWNSLPNWVVSANTTNTFKTRSDKFWHNQDIIYNFRAKLQGT